MNPRKRTKRKSFSSSLASVFGTIGVLIGVFFLTLIACLGVHEHHQRKRRERARLHAYEGLSEMDRHREKVRQMDEELALRRLQ